MKIEFKWKTTKELPLREGINLTLNDLYFIADNQLFSGYFHCNNYFYSFNHNDGIFHCKTVDFWCYKSEVKISG